MSSPQYQARPVVAMPHCVNSMSPLASLFATTRGCSAMRINVSSSIAVPVRLGMSYVIIGRSVASAIARKWRTSPSCGGRL